MADEKNSDWVYLIDQESGASYYANLKTKETCWELPEALGGGAAEDAQYVKLENGWFQYTDDETGRPYYYNVKTEQTMWTLPEDAGPGVRLEESDAASSEGDNDEKRDQVSEFPGRGDFSEYPKSFADDESDDDDEEAAAEARKKEEEAKKKLKEEKRAARRVKILEEVLQSERAYVSSLETLEKVYLVPLRTVADQPKGAIFSHTDLDAVFLNMKILITVNKKFLDDLEKEYENWPNVHFGNIMKNAAKSFRGPYTRYVNNYDQAEKHLENLKKNDKEKHRYLEVCKTHPDANGLDVRSFLIMPVQRVPRYRMLLEDLLAHTDSGHLDEEPFKEALEKVMEVAQHINEEKRHMDEMDQLKALATRFNDEDEIAKDLVRLDRRFVKEGVLTKVRLTHHQKRHVFLFNDTVIYANPTGKGLQKKGEIPLTNGARVEILPKTDSQQFAFALVDGKGKGYTWVAESDAEKNEWYEAILAAIKGVKMLERPSQSADALLGHVASKTMPQRLEAVRAGATLMKYNLRDGKSAPRWVKVWGDKICWGDVRTKDCKSELKLPEATAILHGAKSAAFFKQQGAKKDQDWLCFSVVFKSRTLDFAATNVQSLLDWYLALAHLVPNSSEPLLDESQLRARIEGML
ncbi:hypothetical protein AB1Y20_018941 [Prymnesium parvum]|uniref:Uncharacterized protein n=1 Tax=Prymnesium parvum TaxID=97485 RepID=A0AB34JT83_PRYPA|mmetsp:Transcript_9115/g.22654  ORF Transcript_9115/g.22654 Transcript_9115/m.22654 type:complete len:635 (-) Transcript_9115:315-2219(-)